MKRTAVYWLGALGGFLIVASFGLGRSEERLAVLLLGIGVNVGAAVLVWRRARGPRRRP